MARRGQKLTKKQDEIIALELARGASHVEAAKTAGCGELAVDRRWLDPQFRAVVSRHQEQLIQGVLGKVVKASQSAIAYLEKLVEDPEADERERRQAAKAILDLLVKGCRIMPPDGSVVGPVQKGVGRSVARVIDAESMSNEDLYKEWREVKENKAS